MARWDVTDPYDDEGEFIAVCPECEGSGDDPAYDSVEAENLYGPEDERSPLAPDGRCPVCCGEGRLDW